VSKKRRRTKRAPKRPNPPASESSWPRWTRRAVIAAVGIATIAVFGSVLGFELLAWDDRVHTVDSPHIAHTAYYWGHFEQGMYMPVTFSAWSLLYRVFGANPAPFHGLNLLIHLANALGCFVLLEQLLRAAPRSMATTGPKSTSTGPRAAPITVAAGSGALLFALHPVQVEPVAWVTSLKDLGAGLFSLLAMIGFVRATRRSLPVRHPLVLGSAAALAVATLCKPAAIAVVLMLAVLALWWLELPWRKALARLVPYGVVVVPSAVLNAMSQGRLTQLYEAPLHLRPVIALDSLGFYVGKVLLPLSLSPAYERSPRWLVESGTITYGWLGGAVAIGVVLALHKRWPALLPAFALLVAGVALVLGLKSFAAQDNTTVYDRYLYLAMLGPALLAAWFVWRARRRWQLALVGAVLLALAAKSMLQVPHWRSDHTLWTHALKVRPHSAVALVSMGLIHSKAGDRQKAIEHYRRALRYKPYDVEALHNLGAVLAAEGRLPEAGLSFQAALAHNPKHLSARNHLARVLFELGKLEDAEQEVRRVLEQAPRHPDANIRLGEVLLARGQLPACIAHMEGVVSWLPDHPDALTLLGVALAQSGDERRAIGLFEEALRIQPGHESAQRNLGVAVGRGPGGDR
jgi:tetratricopeptide (TPR) repeat protein